MAGAQVACRASHCRGLLSFGLSRRPVKDILSQLDTGLGARDSGIAVSFTADKRLVLGARAHGVDHDLRAVLAHR
jgi:hypothetical protein